MKLQINLLLVTLVIVVLVSSGCHNPEVVSVRQSDKKFNEYGEVLNKVLEEKGYSCRFEKKEEEPIDKKEFEEPYANVYYRYILKVNETDSIDISFVNQVDENKTGIEEFEMKYVGNMDKNGKSAFDRELFVNLYNTVSGKEISVSFLEDFIAAPEERYPAIKYGYEKGVSDVVDKCISLNLFEDWLIEYKTNTYNVESINAIGLVKEEKGV